jgi:hypothetical protein
VRRRVVVGRPGAVDVGEPARDVVVVQPQDGGHRAGLRVGGGLHRLAALGHDVQPVGGG